MTITVKSLEEVFIDGKPSGTVLDVLTPDNKVDLWLALSGWRDGFLTAKAEEIQAAVIAKETVEADLATTSAHLAEHGALIQEIAAASTLDEVKALLPINEDP